MRHALIGLLLILLATPAMGARIAGTAYTQDLDTARYSLLTINTTPIQRVLLPDGTYDITVPPGTYMVKVVYEQRGIQYEDELQVTILDEGIYSYDFILFPTGRDETQQLPDDDFFIPSPESAPSIGWIPAAIVLLLVASAGAYLGTRRWWSRENAGAHSASAIHATHATPTTAAETPLAADLDAIITVLKEEGGRTTQKELRKRIPCSEAKMSMMLTELEAKGRIERIKKGRGNLIVLKHS